MRRAMLITALAGAVGFLLAGATSFAFTKLNAWRTYGEQFQLGYVVGYLDALKIVKRHDLRQAVPSSGKPKYERWVALVNEYYADPANANRAVPDAILAVGQKLQTDWLRARRERTPVPRSTGSDAAAAARRGAPQPRLTPSAP